MPRRRERRAFGRTGDAVTRWLAFLAALTLAACLAQPQETQTLLVDSARPDRASFDAPSAYMERHCGSLDCHGQPGRPLRVYSQFGMRLSDDDMPGGRPRTDDELTANYVATISLEPEIMTQVAEQHGAEPERLMLIRKPLGTERHKGGQIFSDQSDPGYLCLTSWLRGSVDKDACASASISPLGP